MSSNLSQNSGPRETLEAPKSPALRLVIDHNRMTSIRKQIGDIAESSLQKDFISRETYDGYKDVEANVDAEKRPDKRPLTLEDLESTRKFAEDHEATVFRIHKKIQEARRDKIASEGDERFLMEQIKLKVKDFEFDQNSEWYEKRIDEKLAHMKRDKNQYMELANHKLIKDIGYLKVDGNTRIELPNEEGFLKLTVKERRKLLKELKEALPKAEKYAEECEDNEDKELDAAYKKKLDAARKEGIIGEHTYKEFLNGFKKIDNDEKKYWDSEFESQMERYRVLWTQIRSMLQGEALEEMEGMIDGSGYTDLFKTFGMLKNSESKHINTEYTGELEKYRQDGIIGRHTVAQFVLWMNQQELSDKYDAQERLPEQMIRYEELWENVDTLDKKQQKFLRSKIDIWGYTELDDHYKAFKAGAPIPQSEPSGPDQDPLSQIESNEVKDAILETDEMLEKQGGEKRKSFMDTLRRMYDGISSSKFDASNFRKDFRAKAANDNAVENNTKSREADDEVNFHQIEKDTESLAASGDAKITEDLGFIQVESINGDKTARQTQVTINEEEGMKRFFMEDGKHNYRSEEAGGNDDLSLAIHTDSGRTVELDLQEIQALQKHLKKSEEQERLDEAT